MVASAAGEMTRVIGGTAANTEKAREIKGHAVSQSANAGVQVGKRGQAAQEIGKVKKIAANVNHAADGIGEVNQNVVQTSAVPRRLQKTSPR